MGALSADTDRPRRLCLQPPIKGRSNGVIPPINYWTFYLSPSSQRRLGLKSKIESLLIGSQIKFGMTKYAVILSRRRRISPERISSAVSSPSAQNDSMCALNVRAVILKLVQDDEREVRLFVIKLVDEGGRVDAPDFGRRSQEFRQRHSLGNRIVGPINQFDRPVKPKDQPNNRIHVSLAVQAMKGVGFRAQPGVMPKINHRRIKPPQRQRRL